MSPGHESRITLRLWLLVLIWAANFSVVKAALADFRPLAFNAIRFVLASAVLLAFLWSARKPLRFERRDWPALLALGLVGNTFYQVLFIVGLDWTLAGNAALLLGASPVFVTLLSAGVRHEEPSRAKSDAANALRLDRLEPLLRRLVALDKIVRNA